MLSLRLARSLRACVRASFGMIARLAAVCVSLAPCQLELCAMFRPSQIGNPILFYIQKNMTLAEKRLPAKQRKVRQQQLRAMWDLMSSEAQEQWAVDNIPSSVLCCLLARLRCLPACRACPPAALARLPRLPVCRACLSAVLARLPFDCPS